jgi:60 kDa SS-A/Ro ribonucleoprotein
MMHTYESGHGHLGKLTWDANQKIVSAMEIAFNNSFETLKQSGKNLLIAVDVSGSMSARINNMAIDCRQAGAALSLAFVKSEPNVDLIWFDTQVYKPKTGPHSSYTEVLENTPKGGGTDCSLAFQYALKTKVKYDGIIIITDNETWAGNTHGSVLLNDYRKQINKDVKVVNIGMSATNYSVTDANLNNFHVAGFDASIPEVINSFV